MRRHRLLLASIIPCLLPSAYAFTFRRLKERIQQTARIYEQNEAPYGKFRAPATTDGGTYSARFLEDNGLEIGTDAKGRVTARPRRTNTTSTKPEQEIDDSEESSSLTSSADAPAAAKELQSSPTLQKILPTLAVERPSRTGKPAITDSPAIPVPQTGFNVVLTHCTADFDSLASAVGLAKLWSAEELENVQPNDDTKDDKSFDSASHVPTFVVLPRGAHPGVQRFLALHKHLFPIRSLKSLPSDLSGLNRLALVDAQRRERIGPAEPLLQHAKRVTVLDHHIDQDSDIRATDYVVDKVGSVTTLIVERLQQAKLPLTEAEATLLALGVHADTGSLCFDSTTPRDAYAVAWCLSQGASQAAIAEHAQSSLSQEQQGVLTQALMNANTTVVHGVTVSTVLLSAEGFINGLAAVTQDAMELSSSDVFLLAVVYEAQSGGSRRKKKKQQIHESGGILASPLLPRDSHANNPDRQRRLQSAFDRNDRDGSGYLDEKEIAAALGVSGFIASQETISGLMAAIDTNGDGKVDFQEFCAFCTAVEEKRAEDEGNNSSIKNAKATTMIIIGRVKAGVNMKGVKLNKLLEKFGGGGHPKASSATLRLDSEEQAVTVLQDLVDELVATALQEQPTVGDFMTSPVLSVQPTMTEKQVEDLFTRYDVRALPVVDEDNNVLGLVTYKEVAAAKQRLWNKEQKRLRRERLAEERGEDLSSEESLQRERGQGTTVKGWMKQHVRLIEASLTMAEVESILLESDVGCMPVVEDGTKKLVGMVTRTDLLRQHRYYPSLPYHNKGFADSIANRKPIIELRKKLKKFDLD